MDDRVGEPAIIRANGGDDDLHDETMKRVSLCRATKRVPAAQR
jgi:hypothetical protein